MPENMVGGRIVEDMRESQKAILVELAAQALICAQTEEAKNPGTHMLRTAEVDGMAKSAVALSLVESTEDFLAEAYYKVLEIEGQS